MTACPHFARPSLVAALIAWAPLGALATTTLYDPALGSLPSAQGWLPLVAGAAASQGLWLAAGMRSTPQAPAC